MSLCVTLIRHDYLLNEDEMLKAALGDNYKIEQMRAGVLRLGGVPVSYAEHLLVTGDAAGMIDPMTGEGIHHAMDGGRMAAQTLLECIKQGNYSRDAMNVYQQRWMYAFGSDFKWSDNICLVSSRTITKQHKNKRKQCTLLQSLLPIQVTARKNNNNELIFFYLLFLFRLSLVPVPFPDLPGRGGSGRAAQG